MSTASYQNKSRVIPWIITFVLLLLAVSLGKGIFELLSVYDRVEKEEQAVAELESKQRSLERELKARQEPGFLERQIRDKLHLSKPGEVVVLLPQSEDMPVETEPGVVVKYYQANWQKWLALFVEASR